MKIPTSIRTERGELRYQKAKKNGESRPIDEIPAPNLSGFKIVPNEYPYDIVYKLNDMLVGVNDNCFLESWIKLGVLIDEGKLPYDQLLYNFPKRQTQPHVFHVHLVNFKDREDFEL